jgi:ribokinase
VTAGAAGVYACDADGNEDAVPAPAVDVVETNGAGDAFLAALAVRLRAGEALGDAMRYAVVVASLSVTRAGSIASYPTAAEAAEAAAASGLLATTA